MGATRRLPKGVGPTTWWAPTSRARRNRNFVRISVMNCSSLSRSKFLRQHEGLADPRHVGPVAHEHVDQPRHLLLHRAVERGFISELISRQMNSGVAKAPEPPRL